MPNDDEATRMSRCSEEQIIGVLREVDSGLGLGEVCRKHEICDQTYYRWQTWLERSPAEPDGRSVGRNGKRFPVRP